MLSKLTRLPYACHRYGEPSLAPAALALRSPSVHGPYRFSWSNSQANRSAFRLPASCCSTYCFFALAQTVTCLVFLLARQTRFLKFFRSSLELSSVTSCSLPSSHAFSAPPSHIFRQLMSVFHDPESIRKSIKRSVVLEETHCHHEE